MMRRLLVGLLLLCAAPLAAQQVLTPERMIRLLRVSSPAVSPDGALLVFGVRATDIAANRGNTDLFRLPTAGGAPVRLTDWPGSEVGAQWRPDGKKIGFLSARSGSMQLWEIDPDGRNQRQVSDILCWPTSTTSIWRLRARSITVWRVMPLRKQSAYGVNSLPSLTKNMLAPVASETRPRQSYIMASA